ncbi:hypothetical protein QAD02_013418 [Eretmocerus hayati]|uniref:Uncharacterized protein n=1 Tax=Eretmocerus hayati TaxID=131215 RepID=A0ACC2P2G6_9HYME|nr:hypothetical protein QAD02_013418 [Eretmocerus hayati]
MYSVRHKGTEEFSWDKEKEEFLINHHYNILSKLYGSGEFLPTEKDKKDAKSKLVEAFNEQYGTELTADNIHKRLMIIQDRVAWNENSADSCHSWSESFPSMAHGASTKLTEETNSAGEPRTKKVKSSRFQGNGRWDEDCREHAAFLNEIKRPTLKLIRRRELQIDDKIIGTGAQGQVRLGLFGWTPVAIKSISKITDKNALRELVCLNDLKHQNVILCYGVCLSVTQLHIVMEYFESNSLHDIIFHEETRNKYALTSDEKVIILEQAATGFTYIHSQKILHRNIKPGNILVNVKCLHVKICDLGLAVSKKICKDLKSTREDRMRGTYFFMAPEIFLCEKKMYSNKSDVWAFACTIYELFSHQCVWPVVRNDPHHSTEIALSNRKVPPYEELVPEILLELMKSSFEYKPTARPDMSSFVRTLRSIEQLKKVFTAQLNRSKKVFDHNTQQETCSSSSTAPASDFMVPLLKHRPGLASDLPPAQHVPKRRRKSDKRSKKSSQYMHSVVPLHDQFALVHQANVMGMQQTFQDMSATFAQTQEMVRNVSNQALPKDYVFNMILRKVKCIPESKYSTLMKTVCKALANIVKEDSCN